MKPRKPAREHAAETLLLGEAAAQDDRDFRIDVQQFVEDIRAIHDRHREIEDHERDLILQLAVNVDAPESRPAR